MSGVLVIDKPAGPSSFAVLRQVRAMVQAQHKKGRRDLPDARKAGHGGTLDPMASGVLPVLLGEATKIAPFLLDADKAYEATLALGVETDTQDATGKVIARHEVPVYTDQQWEDALAGLRGEISQVPPMFSALKKDGRRLYDLARAGQEVERAPRSLTIHELRLMEKPTQERASLFVRCSKGTYVRTLAVDLGRALGCGAHLVGLRRVQSGPFCIDEAIAPAALQELLETGRPVPTISLRDALEPMPIVKVDGPLARRIFLGQAVAWSMFVSESGVAPVARHPVGVVGPDENLLAIVAEREGALKILRGFSPEPQPPASDPGT